MNKKKIRTMLELDSDFSLKWDSDFKGSITTSGLVEGRIIMKYSSVPYFLYALAKPIKDFSFLDEKEKSEIISCEKVSFADTGYKEISECVKRDVEFYNSLLKGRIEKGGEEIEKHRLENLRESFGILHLTESFKDKNIDIRNLEYIGRVPDSLEYPQPVHILLSAERETYISQFWQGMNILKIGENETKEIVKDVCKLYGVVVSGALRSLLERQ